MVLVLNRPRPCPCCRLVVTIAGTKVGGLGPIEIDIDIEKPNGENDAAIPVNCLGMRCGIFKIAIGVRINKPKRTASHKRARSFRINTGLGLER